MEIEQGQYEKKNKESTEDDVTLSLSKDTKNDGTNATLRDMKEPWKFRSQEACLQSWGESTFQEDGRKWCNATWDTVLCWPSVPAGNTVYLPCPPLPGLDATQKGFRKCGLDGRWEGGRQPIGYTNYTFCYTPESRKLFQKFFVNKTEEERQMMNDIIVGTRTMEIIGLWISLVTSLVSLFIFSYFRSLRCNRTRIHRNLLIAIIVQTVIRLVLYLDQYIAKEKRSDGSHSSSNGAVFHMSIICEIIYTFLEYTKSVQFMWMLIEGLYLHNMIAVTVFSSKPNYLLYYLLGWVSPIPFIVVWGATTFNPLNSARCWFPYYLEPYHWIVEAPRVAIMAVNLMFLLNIIRVLIKKLRKSHTQEPQVTKVRKAVKAAIVLLPLLGITNFVVMTEPPESVVNFGIWSYSTHFLVSFQGFFISLLYCYLNGEVQDTLKRHFCFSSHHPRWEHSLTSIRLYPLPNNGNQVQMVLRKTWNKFRQTQMIKYSDSNFRRYSRSLSIFTSVTEVPNNNGYQRRPSTVNGNTNSVPLLRDLMNKTDSRL